MWARAAPWRERGGSEWEHEEKKVDSTVKKADSKEETDGTQGEPP